MYADRMIALMLRDLAEQRALILDRMIQTMKASSDGTPAAQRKMVERVKKISNYPHIHLTPGKRGEYSLRFVELTGWNPNTGPRTLPVLLAYDPPIRYGIRPT